MLLFFCVCVNLHALCMFTVGVYICVSMCVLPSVRRCRRFPGRSRPAGHQITAVYYADRLTHWTMIIPLNHSLSLSLPHLYKPRLSFILTHSLTHNAETSSALLWHKCTEYSIWLYLISHKGRPSQVKCAHLFFIYKWPPSWLPVIFFGSLRWSG